MRAMVRAVEAGECFGRMPRAQRTIVRITYPKIDVFVHRDTSTLQRGLASGYRFKGGQGKVLKDPCLSIFQL